MDAKEKIHRHGGRHRHLDGHACWWQPPVLGTPVVGFIELGTGTGAKAVVCTRPHDWDLEYTEEDKAWDE